MALSACTSGTATDYLPEHARQLLAGEPSAAATPAAAAEPDASQPEWLARVNQFRTMAGLDPITANTKMSDADAKHARYLVKNYSSGQTAGIDMHQESQRNHWYSPEGYAAARTSDVIPPGGIELTDKQAVDLWIAGPFHRLPILNPKLKEAGFGSFDEDGMSAIAMQLRKPTALEDPNAPSPTHRSFIRDEDSNPEPESGDTPQRAVEFPPANSMFPLASFNSSEWPDPLASCPGYAKPTGFPITLQLGAQAPAKLDSASLASNGQPLEFCALDASTYQGADQTQTYTGRNALSAYGAIVMVPKARLHTGDTYNVSIVANGRPYSWTFTIGDHGQNR